MKYTLTVILTFFNVSNIMAASNHCATIDTPWISLVSGNIELNAKSQPQQISTSTPFNLIVNICKNNKAYQGELSFNANMPLHKHGMNYQASTTKLDNGQFLIQGSLLHMPGLWRFSFTLDSQTQPLFYNYVLP